MADSIGVWIWVPSVNPIRHSTPGFLASQEEVRRFGGSARRITRSAKRWWTRDHS
jgi:hypothetical protein